MPPRHSVQVLLVFIIIIITIILSYKYDKMNITELCDGQLLIEALIQTLLLQTKSYFFSSCGLQKQRKFPNYLRIYLLGRALDDSSSRRPMLIERKEHFSLSISLLLFFAVSVT